MKTLLIRIPNRIQTFRTISFENRNRNRFAPVTFECVTICDICDQNVTKSVLLNNKKFRVCDLCHKFEIVTFCDRHKLSEHTLTVTGTKPVSVSVWNPDQNDSQ